MLQVAKIHYLEVDRPIFVEELTLQDFFDHLDRLIKNNHAEISSIEFDVHFSSISEIMLFTKSLNDLSMLPVLRRTLGHKSLDE